MSQTNICSFCGKTNFTARVNQLNGKLYQENRYLRDKINDLSQENDLLRKENKDYRLLRKVFGNKQIDNLLQQARQPKIKDKQQQG